MDKTSQLGKGGWVNGCPGRRRSHVGEEPPPGLVGRVCPLIEDKDWWCHCPHRLCLGRERGVMLFAHIFRNPWALAHA